jgi:hypothetical protein
LPARVVVTELRLVIFAWHAELVQHRAEAHRQICLSLSMRVIRSLAEAARAAGHCVGSDNEGDDSRDFPDMA